MKLSPPSGVTVHWAPKGSYRLEHVVEHVVTEFLPNLVPYTRKNARYSRWMLLDTFKHSSQRIIEQKEAIFGDFA